MISGLGLFVGYLLEQVDILNYFTGILLGAGAYFGLFFGFLAVIFFLFGTSMFFLGRLETYWKTLFPLNLGLTLLGISFFQHTDSISSIWIFFAIVLALVIAAILYKTRVIQSKWLIIPLIVLLFIRGDFWTSFVIGIIFMSLAVVEGAVKNSFARIPKH